MKCNVLKEGLKEGLSLVERTTTKSSSLPMLSSILVEGKKSSLKLSATDLEIAISYEMLCKSEEEGVVVIPSKALSQFVGLLSDPSLILQTQEGSLLVEGKNQRALLKTASPDDFPLIPAPQATTTIQVSLPSLHEGMEKVVGMASLNQTRPELSGVLFAFTPKELRVVATDSFRLAEHVLRTEESAHNIKFILPQKAAREILNIYTSLAKGAAKKAHVAIHISSNQVVFEYQTSAGNPAEPHIILTSRLIEGEYPAYQDVVPTHYQTKARIKKTEFLNQLKAAGIFSNKIQEVRISVDPKKKNLELRSGSTDFGENNSSLQALVEGKDSEASFNWRFLMDGLSHIADQEVVFALNGAEGAACLSGVGDEQYQYIIMPLRI